MSPEALMAAGYAAFLVAGAFTLEWLSAHTHRRALRYRTAGFAYDETSDHWTCPEGQHLWPHEFDHERRLVRYRAKAHVCNGCPVKHKCTDSETGREVVRPLDPWPHSEAGRFHRVVALVLVALAGLVVVVGLVRHHGGADLALLVATGLGVALAAVRLAGDLRRAPANFPVPGGVGFVVAGADGARPHSRYASQNRTAPS